MRASRGPAVLLTLLLILCACHREKRVVRTQFLMSTTVEITALGSDEEALDSAVNAAFFEIKRIEAKYSAYLPDSVVARINRAAGLEPVEADEETIEILSECMRLSRISGGAFDITWAPLSDLWDYRNPPEKLPTEEMVKSALEKVDYEKIRLDPVEHTVFLEKKGMRIDLGGIAKGYAVDRAIEVLVRTGVSDAIVNAGGDLRAVGSRGNRPWYIGIRNPAEPGRLSGKLAVGDRAVATSGDYERYFELGGKRYSHIIDPGTGYPAGDSCCKGVTVIADRAMTADALATAAYVRGWNKGLEMIESVPGAKMVAVEVRGGRVSIIDPSGLADWLDRPAGPSAP